MGSSEDDREERVDISSAAAMLGRTEEEIRHFIDEGRLEAERDESGAYSMPLPKVEALARSLGRSDQDSGHSGDDEIFEGEVMGEEPEGTSQLPAVPFERYERLLQQGQDYKTRLDERTRRMEEIRAERDAARVEIDRLWSEIEQLNLIEFQRALQEKTISTLEEEKARLEAERERLSEEHVRLLEEKTELVEERFRLEAELRAFKNRGFWSRLFGG